MAVTARFGNLSVDQFQTVTEVTLDQEDYDWMAENITNEANYNGNDKFHIFDLPFGIIAGYDIYEELVARLQKYDFKKAFTVERKEADESAPQE